MVISNHPVSCETLLSRFPDAFTGSAGDLQRKFTGVSSPETASQQNAIFLASPKVMAAGLASSAGVIIVSPKAREQVLAQPEALANRTYLFAANVEKTMAMVISELFLKTPYTNAAQNQIHPTAVISPDAEISSGVRIGPNAFIGSRVKLASGVYIGANSVIEDQSEIGEHTVIHPLVFIGHSTLVGRGCEIHPNSTIAKEGFGYSHDEKGNHFRIPHQGRVVLEDNVHIGSSCTIDRATFGETRIEFGAKFDNQVHIAHNCKIGRNALLTAGFTIAGSSTIGANFVAGGRTVVTGHIKVSDNVQLGGLSGVSKSIDKPGAYAGYPLAPLQQSLKITASMLHLPEMRKQINRIMKHLNLTED